MADQLEKYLFNEKHNIHADYVASQWTPAKSKKTGRFVEAINWREDRKCGAKNLNTIGEPARCNHPYTGVDKDVDMSRCCYEGVCSPLNQTDCIGPDASW